MPQPVFISHANDDKRAITPILVELLRRDIPMFIDQKLNFVWPESIEPSALSDQVMIRDISRGKFSPIVKAALRETSLFVLLFTDRTANKDSGVWKELGEYIHAMELMPRPQPCLVQALPLTQPRKPPVEFFLQEDVMGLNVVGIEQEYFDRRRDVELIADIIEAAYVAEVLDELVADRQARQQSAAQKHRGGLLRRPCNLSAKCRVDVIYVPGKSVHEKGSYVSASAISELCFPTDSPIGYAEALKLSSQLPARLNAIDAETVPHAFCFTMKDGSVVSPYGLNRVEKGGLFWARDGQNLVAVDFRGRPRSDVSHAFFFLQF